MIKDDKPVQVGENKETAETERQGLIHMREKGKKT